MTDDHSPAWSIRSIKKWLSSAPENRDDLMQLVQASRDFLEPDTVEMLEGVLGLPATLVREIMTPRPSVVGLTVDDELLEILPVLIDSAHSRFPVFSSDNPDNIVGILLAKDILRFVANPSVHFDLTQYLRAPVFVPETARSDQLMRLLKGSQSHMAVVVDEYGNTSGIVTLEDLLEEIVGEIEDEHDDVDPNANYIIPDPIYPEAFIVQALTPIEYFNERLEATLSSDGVETIGGLVLKEIGRVTDIEGQSIEIQNWHFKVLAAQARSLSLLRVHRVV